MFEGIFESGNYVTSNSENPPNIVLLFYEKQKKFFKILQKNPEKWGKYCLSKKWQLVVMNGCIMIIIKSLANFSFFIDLAKEHDAEILAGALSHMANSPVNQNTNKTAA